MEENDDLLINEKNTTAGKVFITRGNHEEISINIGEGFLENMQKLFSNTDYDYIGLNNAPKVNSSKMQIPKLNKV